MIFQCYAWLLEAILIGKWWSTIDFVLGSPTSGHLHLLNWRGPVLLFRECVPSNHQMLQFKSIDIHFQSWFSCQKVGISKQHGHVSKLVNPHSWGSQFSWQGLYGGAPPPFWDKPMLVGKAYVECMTIMTLPVYMHTVSIYNVNPGTLSWTLSCLIGRVAFWYQIFKIITICGLLPYSINQGEKKSMVDIWRFSQRGDSLSAWRFNELGSRCLLCALVPTSRAASRAAERWKWLSHASQTQLFVLQNI